MTDWTDERLVALLTHHFAAHEADADPVVAHRIAAAAADPPRRRGWPVAAVAAVAVVAGLTAYVVGTPGPAVPPPAAERPPAVSVPAASAAGTNRALALAEARRLIETVPVPPGATRSQTAPARRLERLRVQAGPVDASLTQTRWWVVPLAFADLVAWYDAHSPANTSSAYAPSSTAPVPDGDLYWELPGDSAAFSRPAAVVSYARLGPGSTAIRTDVTLAARDDRTAETLVPSGVTSVDITRSALAGPTPDPVTVTVSDPTMVSRIASSFNDLDGAMAHTEPVGCGSPVGTVYVHAVTFHWAGHTLAVDPGAALCGVGMGLTYDGTALPQKIEADDRFDALLEAAVDAS